MLKSYYFENIHRPIIKLQIDKKWKPKKRGLKPKIYKIGKDENKIMQEVIESDP